MNTTAAAETDLMIPVPQNERWDGHTIHTHYFGFSIPEAAIGAFIYLRYQPVYGICSGGVCLFRGMNNLRPLDIEHHDYVVTMPYPRVVDGVIETSNGLRVHFIEPGRRIHLRYASKDGAVSFDLLQTAITPLLARGHVMPGESTHSDPAQRPGGSEQFMHCTGELQLHGQTYPVDCHPIRGRSWRQVRTEDELPFPPVGWSPMYFGTDLSFNQVGIEAIDTAPVWKDVFSVDPQRPAHHFAWLLQQQEIRAVTRVRRRVLRHHPQLFAATEQQIEAEDSDGHIHRFSGEAIAMAVLPSWPNNLFVDSVYRWRDARGRESFCTYQETWHARFQRFMHQRAGDASTQAS